jgi:predicted acylesterase/phospholipase RssA
MTTAFVLGGGGLLGAHEVGMLRALVLARAAVMALAYRKSRVRAGRQRLALTGGLGLA